MSTPGTASSGVSAEAVRVRRILVVEDHEDNRRILRDLLTSAGYAILEAETGEDGVLLAAAELPDLILMDIQLPGIDGYEATRRIKATAALRDTPLIAVTSYALSGDDARAREAGADDYVAKPFSPRALLAKVRAYLP
jgi:two-component system cell cycle response regulator DivK